MTPRFTTRAGAVGPAKLAALVFLSETWNRGCRVPRSGGGDFFRLDVRGQKDSAREARRQPVGAEAIADLSLPRQPRDAKSPG